MENASFNFGRRKLYFLRLRRLCQVLQCAKTEGLSQKWLGHHSFSVLAAAEDFRVISPSVKRRIFCLMWHLLSKHRFHEAARLLVHTIHVHPFPPSWIWRIAFHLFRCLDTPENFLRFNHALDQFRLADENNRVLERIMHHMVRGELSDAHNCRSLKLTHRDRYTSSGSVLTGEPEFDHVQRLQHLYEGLCFYCLWLKHLHSHGGDPDEQATTDELAERAFYRLQEVEALVSGFSLDALDISFLLLDHPSWAVYNEPWKLLRKSIETFGKQRPEVMEAISVRQRIWLQIHFQLKHLPLSAQKVKKIFSNSTSTVIANGHDPFGPLLIVQPLHEHKTEVDDSSAMETST
ncbi:hypothetical protein AHF37_01857 [Paragonimus kellicotti]|nr:hypothetical protein AHF37_01857 [Paragonimus kellicotti]